MATPNDFMSGFQSGLAPFDYVQRNRERQAATAESTRRFDAELDLSKQREARNASYMQGLELEAKIRADAAKFRDEQLRKQVEDKAKSVNRIKEITQQLDAFNVMPGASGYASKSSDLLNKNADLLASDDPEIQRTMQTIMASVARRTQAGVLTELQNDMANANALGMDVQSYRQRKKQAELAALGVNDAVPTLPNGEPDEVGIARMKYQAGEKSKEKEAARLNDKGGYYEQVTGYDDQNRPTGKLRLSPEDAERRGLLNTKAAEENPKVVELRKQLVDLQALKKRGVNSVAEAAFQEGKIKADSPLTWGFAIDKAIKQVESELAEAGGSQPASPTAAAPPPAESPITATNPKTGEKVMLKDGQWVPLK